MNPPAVDMETLGQRLSRLERENRRLKRLGGLILLGFTAVVLMGQATPRRVAKVIEAEEFILRDGTGKERAKMHAFPGGTVGLQLLDNDHRTRILFGLRRDGSPLFSFFDKDDKLRASLILQADGSPILGFFDKDDKLLWEAP